jgi:hypothetical protein
MSARTWVLLLLRLALPLAPVLLFSLGCQEQDCGYNQKYVPVHGGDQGEYVCLPDDDNEQQREPPPSSKLPPPSNPPASSSASSAPPPSLTSPPPQCLSLPASPTDVRVIPKPGKAPAVTEVWPADGDYSLAQASSYAPNGGASPIQLLRASLQVGGHVLVLGARGSTGGALEANESFTLTLAPGAPAGTLTKVCQTSDGPLGWAMIPGPNGSNRSALLGWDGAIGVITLVLVTPYGEVELLFVKKT